MWPMTIRGLAAAVGGTVVGTAPPEDLTVSALCRDSRQIVPGSLYLPLSGERFDGHDFIDDALARGAVGCLTAKVLPHYRADKCYIKVPDTRLALRDLARYFLEEAALPCVGITGSVGKTTTKEMIAAVLSQRRCVLKTEGNLNNDIGLPLTLLRLTPAHEICVLEMGTNHFGEIDYLARIAPPDTAVLTNIGDCHIEFLGSREGVLMAKSELFAHMAPGGLAVLNGDDALLAPLHGKLPVKTVLCGTLPGLDYTATDIREDDAGQVVCTVTTPRTQFTAIIPAPGRHMIYPALMAAAVGERYGMTGGEIAAGILCFAPGAMRMNVIDRADSIRILDDAYNANPQSMKAAIDVLAGGGAKCRVAVLGDMFELGGGAQVLHAEVGAYLGRSGVNCLVAVGPLARHIAQAAKGAGCAETHWVEDTEAALPILRTLARPHTTFLVKASRGMAFERIVSQLKEITNAGESKGN